MLDKALEHSFKQILIVGHMGKLIKVAAGIFYTHNRVADARMEILCAYAALTGASKEVINSIYCSRTTEAVMDIINANDLTSIYEQVVNNTVDRCFEYVQGKMQIGAVLFRDNNVLLAQNIPTSMIEELFK